MALKEIGYIEIGRPDNECKLKIGMGVGSQHLFLKNEYGDFFEDIDDFFYCKQDLLTYLQDAKEEFFHPSENYHFVRITKKADREQGVTSPTVSIPVDLKQYWNTLIQEVKNLEEISYLGFVKGMDNDDAGRFYYHNDSANSAYSILYRMCIPTKQARTIQKYRSIYKLVKIQDTSLNKKFIHIIPIFNMDYSIEQLSSFLKRDYPVETEKQKSFVFDFFFKYADLIKTNEYSLTEIVERAGINIEYVDELQIALGSFSKKLADVKSIYHLHANSERIYDDGVISKPTLDGHLQQIFYGAPGTGKSHKIKDDVDVKAADEKNLVFRTTFHPDSDYSTFVGCYKPTTSKFGIRGKQPILDYDSLVDKFKEYLNVPNVNITKACTLFGFDYHDSIIRIQENGRKVMDLVNDAYKSNTSYDSVVRGGMACYEQNPIQENGSKITYEFVPQAFTNAYVKAWNTDDDVYLVIEEINRGNCAQIFGDLFQLLDRKNGVSEYPVEADTDLQNYLCKALADTKRTDIPNDVKSGKKLMLPSNLYIWATMNTSDQSLFPIDSAFKRRWEWKYIKIKEGKDENGNKLDWKVDVKMDESGTLLPWWDFIKKINEIIASMTSSADKQLGYFFCCAKDGLIDKETFVSKVIFYLWNDVFKDYGFEDASLFRYTTKDEDGKDTEKDLTFPDFYDEEGEKVNTERLTDFVKKVMSWKVDNKKDED